MPENEITSPEIEAILTTIAFLTSTVLRSVASGTFTEEQKKAWIERIKAAQAAPPDWE